MKEIEVNSKQKLEHLEAQMAYVLRELKEGHMKYKTAVPIHRDLEKKIVKAKRAMKK